MAHSWHLLSLFETFRQLTELYSLYNFAEEWIRTKDVCRWKRPLCQLSHEQRGRDWSIFKKKSPCYVAISSNGFSQNALKLKYDKIVELVCLLQNSVRKVIPEKRISKATKNLFENKTFWSNLFQ